MLPERRAGEAVGPDVHEFLHDGRGRGDEERLHPAQRSHDRPDEDEEGHGGEASRNRRENGRSTRWVMRPGRGDMTMSLVPMNSASSTQWVMKNTVLRMRCQLPRMSSCAFSLVSSSSAPSGSSISSTLGSQVRARAM